MSKFRSARAVIAGAAVVALAGCSATASSSGAAPVSTSSSAVASPVTTPNAKSNAFGPAGAAPYPIAVGNTWVYQTTANIDGERGIETKRVLSVVPVSGGRRVTMSETNDLDGAKTTNEDVFVFYSNGTIEYPVVGSEVSVLGSGVLWPSAAGLASGRAFRSVERIKVSPTGPAQYANVAVQGQGTHAVTVPPGTYQATLVTMTMAVKVGGYTSTEEVETWDAPGTGPVKSEVLVLAAGHTKVTATNELLSFTKG
jgi:hypothetical protein